MNDRKNEYYQKNKLEISEKSRKWYEKNKEQVLERMKQYNQQNICILGRKAFLPCKRGFNFRCRIHIRLHSR